jgi:hypothetical protein
MNNVVNPFEKKDIAVQNNNSVEIEAQRAVAEVQASMMLAKRFPRDQANICNQILLSCQRPTLARQAMYRYARGGTDIVGASIKLAQALAQQWGNIKYGWKTISQTKEYSEIETFAWDIETNTHISKRITIKHWRDTKKGGYLLTDERDIYEICANNASRRMRACILKLIPSDVVEMATQQCEKTLLSSEVITPESVQKLVEAFKEFDVTRQTIEAYIQRKIEAITPQNMVSLRLIYRSIKDGVGKVEDYFKSEIIDVVANVNPLQKEKSEVQTAPEPVSAPTPAPVATPQPIAPKPQAKPQPAPMQADLGETMDDLYSKMPM